MAMYPPAVLDFVYTTPSQSQGGLQMTKERGISECGIVNPGQLICYRTGRLAVMFWLLRQFLPDHPSFFLCPITGSMALCLFNP
jgi:hypothetical protein